MTQPFQPTWRSFWCSGGSRFIIVAVGFCALVMLLYLEQNQSGKAGWLKHKRALEARGEKLDWDTYIPEPVPDDQNIFAVPEIRDSFIKGGSARLTRPLNPWFPTGERPLWQTGTVARLTIVMPNQPSPPEQADLTLYYDAPSLRVATTNDESAPAEPIIPLIVMEEVPLTDAIRHLAKQADIRYVVHPDNLPHDKGNPPAQPYVSIRWENVTARHALKGLLKNYGLALVDQAGQRAARVIPQDPAKPKVFMDAETRQKIAELTSEALGPTTEVRKQTTLSGAQGFTFFKAPMAPLKPVHILVRSEVMPNRDELAAFFAEAIPSGQRDDTGPLIVKATGTNTFDATISPRLFDAAEYLEWSDQFEGFFDLMREALKRPSARMDGNYAEPFDFPIQNFVAMRTISQTLAQRAQCSLLLGEPEEALRELTLLHEMRRMLEPTHSSNAVTLVAAMINVAIAGVYDEVIADGLRLHAWKEPHLYALEKQLGEVDLMPTVVQSLRTERAAMCQTLEMTPPGQLSSLLSFSPGAPLSKKIRDPQFWILSTAPRGWLYDNMVTISSFHETLLENYDSQSGTIRPKGFETASQSFEKKLNHWSPGSFIAAIAIPNFTRAWQTAAESQDKARQALLACALERYWLQHRGYPESLDCLIPDFLTQLPVDVITGTNFHYAPKSNVRFLLYSVGWNEKDDGGVVVRQAGSVIDLRQGDWVWMPEKS